MGAAGGGQLLMLSFDVKMEGLSVLLIPESQRRRSKKSNALVPESSEPLAQHPRQDRAEGRSSGSAGLVKETGKRARAGGYAALLTCGGDVQTQTPSRLVDVALDVDFSVTGVRCATRALSGLSPRRGGSSVGTIELYITSEDALPSAGVGCGSVGSSAPSPVVTGRSLIASRCSRSRESVQGSLWHD